MSTPRRPRVALLALGLALATPLAAEPLDTPRLGRAITEQEAARWDLNVFPDGAGLPAGGGNAVEGRRIYDAVCATCHGPEGIGGSAPELGGGKSPLTSEYPDQNIGMYWPHATTVFDFTRRSMPMFAPGSLSDDQVYALTAYLLHINGIIGETEVMNAQSLPAVTMPNREGFRGYWPDAGPPPP